MKQVQIIRDGKIVALYGPAEFSQMVRNEVDASDSNGLSLGLDAYVEMFNMYNVRIGAAGRAQVTC